MSEGLKSDLSLLRSLVPGCKIHKGSDGPGTTWYTIDSKFIESDSDQYFRSKLSQYESSRDRFSGTDEYYLGDGYMITVNTTDAYSDTSDLKKHNLLGSPYGTTADGKVCGELFGVGLVKEDVHFGNY